MVRSPPSRGRRPTLPVILVVLLASACTTAGTGSGTPYPSGSIAISHPDGDALVLRLATGGGFAGPGFDFGRLPAFTLLGDGRVIVPAPVDAVAPGPELPAALVRRLSETGLQAVLRAVLATGVFDADHDYDAASARVADAPTTTFRLHAQDRVVTVAVYALGILSPGDSVPGMTTKERDARVALQDLAMRLGNADALVGASGWTDGGWTAFPPDALRILALPVTTADPAPSPGPKPVAWPGEEDPATDGSELRGGRCLVVEGAGLARWLRVLEAATATARYVTPSGDVWSLEVRPLLPDEPRSCAGAG